MAKEIDPPIQKARNPIATVVYDEVMTSRGKSPDKLSKSLVKRLDELMNRMLRRGLSAAILREQRRMIDALATDTISVVENKDDTITVTYKIQAWHSLTRMLDQFEQQDELAKAQMAEFEKDLTERDAENEVREKGEK